MVKNHILYIYKDNLLKLLHLFLSAFFVLSTSFATQARAISIPASWFMDESTTTLYYTGDTSFVAGEDLLLDADFVRAVLVAPSLSFQEGPHTFHATKMATGQAWQDLQNAHGQTLLAFTWGTDTYGVSGWRYQTGAYSVWDTPLDTSLYLEDLTTGFVNILIVQE